MLLDMYYTEVNLTCIIILLLLNRQMSYKKNHFSTSSMILRKLMWFTAAFCLSDMIAGIIAGKTIRYAYTILEISNLLYFILSTVIAYLWFSYVLVQLKLVNLLDRMKVRLTAIPLIIFILVGITNHFTNFLFLIDENNTYQRGPGVSLHWIVCWGYMLAATIATAVVAAKRKDRLKRQEIIPLLYFAVAPMAASVLQVFLFGISAIQVGITISITMFCLSEQNKQILTDSLTSLNNRRAFDNYLSDYMLRRSDTELSIFMVDIDNFKHLNDKYGHMTGDIALQETAKVLKNACREMPNNLFLCRFGGDEFVMAGAFKNEAEQVALENLIHSELEAISQEGRLPYSLKVSVGISSGKCSSYFEAEKLLRSADEAMYAKKCGAANKI